jgi:hypothetical protein
MLKIDFAEAPTYDGSDYPAPLRRVVAAARGDHERAEYPDVDLVAIGDEHGGRYTHKNGQPY